MAVVVVVLVVCSGCCGSGLSVCLFVFVLACVAGPFEQMLLLLL